MKKTNRKDRLLWGLISIPYLLLIPATFWYLNKLENIKNSSFVVINKAEMTLYLNNYKGELMQKSRVATGENFGNKKIIGDLKTPEGIFKIAGIQNATSWKHDFEGDSIGEIKGAYGPFFIRLDVPGQKGIGIHGTHDNNSIGTRASEGCIRMLNAELTQLVKSINTVSVVIITPGIDDVMMNNNDTLKTVKNTKTIVLSNSPKHEKHQKELNNGSAKPNKSEIELLKPFVSEIKTGKIKS